jgi:hypothetical protein
MVSEIKFNLFSFISLIGRNIKKIILILLICLAVSFYSFKLQKVSYTGNIQITALEPIQNQYDALGFKSTQLLKLFNYRYFHEETIQSTLDEISKNHVIVNTQSDIDNATKITVNEDTLNILFSSSDKVYISKFIYAHVNNVKKDMIAYLRSKLSNQIYVNELLQISQFKVFERNKLRNIKQINNELDLLNIFYSEERNNILKYLRQNRNLANSMGFEFPVASITSEHSSIISIGKKIAFDQIEDINNFLENNGQFNSLISLQDIIKNNILLGLPAYIFGTKMLDELILIVEGAKLAGISEVEINLQKKLAEIESTDNFYKKNTSIDIDLEKSKSKLGKFNYISSDLNTQLFNLSNTIEYQDNRVSLTFLLIIGLIIGSIISILFIIPYRKLVDENK